MFNDLIKPQIESTIKQLTAIDLLLTLLAKSMANFLNNMISQFDFAIKFDDLQRYKTDLDTAKRLHVEMKAKCMHLLHRDKETGETKVSSFDNPDH